MLATLELILEAAQSHRLAQVLPRYLREVPLYRNVRAHLDRDDPAAVLAQLRRLPYVHKGDLRRGFPGNFLTGPEVLGDLLAREAVELEYTSGTQQERIPLLLPRGWWFEQERRALSLNPLVAGLLEAEQTTGIGIDERVHHEGAGAEGQRASLQIEHGIMCRVGHEHVSPVDNKSAPDQTIRRADG